MHVYRALLRAGYYHDCSTLLRAYDAAGFVRLNIVHDALVAVGFGAAGVK